MNSGPNQERIQAVLKKKGLDEALRLAGDFNFYQWKVMIFLGVQWIFTSFVIMIQPFLNQMPEFECPEENGQMVTCNESQATETGCNIDWASSPNSLIISLGLYCDKAYLRTLAQSLFFAGGSIGTLFLSKIGDLKGRKPALMISYALGSISIFILAVYHSNPYVYMILLSFCWAGYDPFFAFSLIIVNEKGCEKIRQFSNPFLLVNWGCGEMIFVMLAYFIQNYEIELLYVVAIPGILASVLFLGIRESPRFLYAKNKIDHVSDVIGGIAIENNKYHKFDEENCPTIEPFEISSKESSEQSEDKAVSYKTLYNNKILRKKLIFYSIIIAYLYLAYNGILFGLNYLQGSLYTNSLVTASAETLAYIVSIFLVPRIKRKTLFRTLFFVGSIFGVLFQFIPKIIPLCSSYSWCTDDMLTAIFCLFMKFCNAFAFGLIYIYGSEIFPTVVRSKCMGVGISFGRAVSTLAPFLNVFAVSLDFNPLFFYGLGGLICLPLLNMLPETFGGSMIDQLEEETEDLSKKIKLV